MPNTATSLARSIRRNPLALAGSVLIVLLVFCAAFGPLIAPRDPSFIDLAARLQPPSAHHLLGTDELGRDIFSRLLYGARYAMIVGCSVVAGSLLLGTLVGSLAGYYGGRLDRFI